jgi:hypothetical protein
MPDRTSAEPPVTGRAVAGATARVPGDASADADEAARAPGEATGRARRLPSGWYLLGLAVQVFLWFLVFLGIAVAIGVGGHLTEFRYVGF